MSSFNNDIDFSGKTLTKYLTFLGANTNLWVSKTNRKLETKQEITALNAKE